VSCHSFNGNPNPLYPKNVGYPFRGYVADDSRVPTFLYRSGTVGIEDRTTAVDGEQPQLRRVMTLRSSEPQTIWFRALVGEITQESDRVFRNGRLRLTIRADARLRPLSDNPDQSELLLRLQLSAGTSSLELVYALLAE
jgi:hypothetical protein